MWNPVIIREAASKKYHTATTFLGGWMDWCFWKKWRKSCDASVRNAWWYLMTANLPEKLYWSFQGKWRPYTSEEGLNRAGRRWKISLITSILILKYFITTSRVGGWQRRAKEVGVLFTGALRLCASRVSARALHQPPAWENLKKMSFFYSKRASSPAKTEVSHAKNVFFTPKDHPAAQKTEVLQ